MGYHRGKAIGERSVLKTLPAVALAASLLLSGCQPNYSSGPGDVSNQAADRAGAPVSGMAALSTVALSSDTFFAPSESPAPFAGGDTNNTAGSAVTPKGVVRIAPIRNVDDAAQDGATYRPAAGDAATEKTALDQEAGNPEAAAGYGLAERSAIAASSGASPSPLNSLFGLDYSGKVSDPPRAPYHSPDADARRLSLVGLTLRDAVGLAIAHHPDVSQGVAVVSESAAEVAVAKGAWFPVLNYSIAPGYGSAYSRENTSGAQSSGGISQLLYDFGKTSGQIEQADAALNRQRHALNNTIEGVAYTAASQYVEFAAAQATLNATGEEIAHLNKLRAMIAERVRASLSSASDLTQADVAVQRAVVDQVQARTRLNDAAGKLAEIIGVRPESVADLASVNEAAMALDNGDGDIEDAPMLRAAKAAIKEAEAQVKVAESAYYPAISIVANKNVMSGGGDNAYDTEWAGVALSGSISAVGQNSHRVEAARANRDAMERQFESQRLSLRTVLTSTATELEGANTRRQVFDAMQGLSRTSRDLYWQEYTLGNRPLTQVLDAERDIFSAEASRITAIADGIAARLKARAAMGLLVSGLRASDR